MTDFNLLFSSFLLPDIRECMAEEWKSPIRIHQTSYSNVGKYSFMFVPCFCACFIGLLAKASTVGRRKLISRHRNGNVLSNTARAGSGWPSQYILKSNWKHNPIPELEKIITLEIRKSVLWLHTLGVPKAEFIKSDQIKKTITVVRIRKEQKMSSSVRDAAEKKRDFLGIFPKGGGGGLLKSQNFCKFTKCFFVCQNHS